MIQAKDIIEAHERISPFIHQTPVLTSKSINQMAQASLFFKCENFQKAGAFKSRGATNAILKIPENQRQFGVVTHSSGNHAQALALAALRNDIKCYVVMPENAPQIKVDAVKSYGGLITFCLPTQTDREKYTQEIVSNTGATFIPPYDHKHIVTGQSTAAKEVYDELSELDFIITPVGGGGLLSGTILSTQYFSPNTQVIAAEPFGADDAYRSWKSGELVRQQQPNTIADGLLTTLGNLNWSIIQHGVHDIIRVDDDEIRHAMELIFQRMKIIIEPSSATVLAAVLKNQNYFKGKKIALILSGGNYAPSIP